MLNEENKMKGKKKNRRENKEAFFLGGEENGDGGRGRRIKKRTRIQRTSEVNNFLAFEPFTPRSVY